MMPVAWVVQDNNVRKHIKNHKTNTTGIQYVKIYVMGADIRTDTLDHYSFNFHTDAMSKQRITFQIIIPGNLPDFVPSGHTAVNINDGKDEFSGCRNQKQQSKDNGNIKKNHHRIRKSKSLVIGKQHH